MVKSDFRVVIVTGGAQGIGRGIVEDLLARGNAVVAADIDAEAGQELIRETGNLEGLSFYRTDVGDERQVKACIEHTVRRFGRITGVVNNAGIANPGDTPVTRLSLDSWERMIRTNLTGSFLMAKHAAPHLEKYRGAIVNISSTRALQSEAHTEAYSASKGGLVSLTHSLAVSFSGKIRVNVILPGWIDVGGYQKKSARYELNPSDEDHSQHPAGRIGRVEDVASMAAYLLSDEAGFITGQQFVVDGGMTKKMIYVE